MKMSTVFNQILTKYKLAPELTRRRLKIEAMESILSSASKKFIVQQDDNGLLQVLPLDEEGTTDVPKTNVIPGVTKEGENDHE